MLLTRLITCFFAFLSFLSTPAIQASESSVKGNTADYVIVGVGTAGALLAKRLTDDKKTSVIAIHSGKNFTDSFILKYSKNTPFSVLSALLGVPPPFNPAALDLPPDIQKELSDLIQLTTTTARPLYESGVSTPQPNADDQEIPWVIPLPGGGGSSVNAGAWCRGTNQVFAQWEAIAGPEWSVGRILDTYKQLEKYRGKTTNPNARGFHGPLHVLQDSPPSRLAQVFGQAVVSATGTSFVLDYNDPNTPIGVSTRFQLTHHGEDGFFRASSASTFLNKDVMRANGKGVHGRKLRVLFDSTALRTIWQGTKAVGVEYVKNGISKKVYAKKGVIVCAGLRSSAFLLSSGVGLNSVGIPIVNGNPNVGQGLADQSHVVMLFTSNPKDSVAGSNRIFSQISWLPAPFGDPTIRQLRFSTVDMIPGLTAALLDLCQPQSRGSVTINSANPLDPPVINLGVLSNPNDLDLLVSGFQIYVKAINQQLQAVDPQYGLIYPDPAILDDTVALTAFIQASIGSNMHFQSHCRMAPENQGGVVDSHGRVYGVQNLYVADNSINPLCQDGSPMATGYLVAANIARLLGH